MGKALRVKNDRKARIHYLLSPIHRAIYNRKRNDVACVPTAVRPLELQCAGLEDNA